MLLVFTVPAVVAEVTGVLEEATGVVLAYAFTRVELVTGTELELKTLVAAVVEATDVEDETTGVEDETTGVECDP